MVSNKVGALKRIMFICLRADDAVQLVSFGQRGGSKVEWVFRKGCYSA